MKRIGIDARLAAVAATLGMALLPLTLEWAPRNWLDQQGHNALIAANTPSTAQVIEPVSA